MYPAAARMAATTAPEIHIIRDLRREKSSALTGTSTKGCWFLGEFPLGSGTLFIIERDLLRSPAIEDHETRSIDHRWSLHRQPWTGGMGVYFALRRKEERAVRLRAAHDQ